MIFGSFQSNPGTIHSTPATPACTAVAGHICASCLNGYYMAGTACAAYEGSCNNGAMIAQSSRTQENHCGTCGSGFGMTSTFSCETCSATDFQYSSENDNSPCAELMALMNQT